MGSRANVPAAGTGTASREHGAAADERRPPGSRWHPAHLNMP